MNLAHLTGYVGLATVYTNQNLLFDFGKNNELLENEDEYQRLSMQRACIECLQWALRVVSNARDAKQIQPPCAAPPNAPPPLRRRRRRNLHSGQRPP
eukprot:4667430-Prymnesium_polylepis.1